MQFEGVIEVLLITGSQLTKLTILRKKLSIYSN